MQVRDPAPFEDLERTFQELTAAIENERRVEFLCLWYTGYRFMATVCCIIALAVDSSTGALFVPLSILSISCAIDLTMSILRTESQKRRQIALEAFSNASIIHSSQNETQVLAIMAAEEIKKSIDAIASGNPPDVYH